MRGSRLPQPHLSRGSQRRLQVESAPASSLVQIHETLMLEGQPCRQQSGRMNPLWDPTDLRRAKGTQKTALLTQRTRR